VVSEPVGEVGVPLRGGEQAARITGSDLDPGIGGQRHRFAFAFAPAGSHAAPTAASVTA
jgi:hypothetical protein